MVLHVEHECWPPTNQPDNGQHRRDWLSSADVDKTCPRQLTEDGGWDRRPAGRTCSNLPLLLVLQKAGAPYPTPNTNP